MDRVNGLARHAGSTIKREHRKPRRPTQPRARTQGSIAQGEGPSVMGRQRIAPVRKTSSVRTARLRSTAMIGSLWRHFAEIRNRHGSTTRLVRPKCRRRATHPTREPPTAMIEPPRPRRARRRDHRLRPLVLTAPDLSDRRDSAAPDLSARPSMIRYCGVWQRITVVRIRDSGSWSQAGRQVDHARRPVNPVARACGGPTSDPAVAEGCGRRTDVPVREPTESAPGGPTQRIE
jgi:hypothetical protein